MNQPVPPPVPEKGLIARAIGIITSPKATYEAVVRSPRPFGILFLCALVIGISQAVPQFTERGRQAVLDMQVQQSERWSGKPVSDEAYKQMERMSRFNAYFTLAGPLVMLPVASLLLTAVLWAVFNALLGGTATFKQVLAVVAHSWVIDTFGSVVGTPIQLMSDTMSMAGPFNLGVLLPGADETGFLSRFLGSLSVFTIWSWIVVAIGLAVLYRRKTTNTALSLLAARLIIAAVIIAAFSGFGSR